MRTAGSRTLAERSTRARTAEPAAAATQVSDLSARFFCVGSPHVCDDSAEGWNVDRRRDARLKPSGDCRRRQTACNNSTRHRVLAVNSGRKKLTSVDLHVGANNAQLRRERIVNVDLQRRPMVALHRAGNNPLESAAVCCCQRRPRQSRRRSAERCTLCIIANQSVSRTAMRMLKAHVTSCV